jgi:hypothetical protein
MDKVSKWFICPIAHCVGLSESPMVMGYVDVGNLRWRKRSLK